MKLIDQRDISADTATVWQALIDAEVLRQCISGCKEMNGSIDQGYEAVVVQKVGPVKATFRGTVSLTEVVIGERCKIVGEGKGGAAGFAKGGADVVLTPNGEGTRLSYDVNAKVGGKLAQLGNRIIDGFAKKMADEFFDSFKKVVEGGGEAVRPADAAGAPAAPDTPPDDGSSAAEEKSGKGWIKRLISD